MRRRPAQDDESRNMHAVSCEVWPEEDLSMMNNQDWWLRHVVRRPFAIVWPTAGSITRICLFNQ